MTGKVNNDISFSSYGFACAIAQCRYAKCKVTIVSNMSSPNYTHYTVSNKDSVTRSMQSYSSLLVYYSCIAALYLFYASAGIFKA